MAFVRLAPKLTVLTLIAASGGFGCDDEGMRGREVNFDDEIWARSCDPDLLLALDEEPVVRPTEVNTTDWTTEELEENWTYSAIDHFWPRLTDDYFTHSADLSTRDSLETWRESAGDRFAKALRLDLAEWPDTPLMIQTNESENMGSYRRDHIDYLVEPGFRIPAYLLVPNDASGAPGIVYWHGHNSGGKDEPVAVNGYQQDNNYHHAAAARLAEAGYVVLAPDIRTFGETGDWDEHVHFSQALNLHGFVALGVFLADAVKAVDVLSAQPEVDPERIGTAGISLGGQMALYLAAIDHRVEVAVVEGYFGSVRDTLLRMNADACQYAHALSMTMDIPDVALIAAPRPILFTVGQRDPFWKYSTAEAAFARVAEGYALLGVGDRVRLETDDVGHEWIHEPALQWFDEWL